MKNDSFMDPRLSFDISYRVMGAKNQGLRSSFSELFFLTFVRLS